MAVKHTFTSTIEDGADNTLVQPSDWNAEHVLSNALGAIDALTPAASKIPYFTGAAAATLADITATGVSLLGAANAAGARTTLELGTIATQAADNVSLTGGSISGMTSISGSTLTSTVVIGTAPFSVTSTTLVANLNTDTVDGFHASQTPAANQIPVLNSAGRLVLDGTDDGSSKIQTGGVIKAGSLILMGGELIGSSSLLAHPNTSDGADSGVSYVCGGGWPLPSRGGYLEVHGNESASNPGDAALLSGGSGNIKLLTGGGYERLKIVPAGRCILSGGANTASLVDDGVNALQVNGTIASKGIKLDGTASSNVNTLDYYKEGTFTPVVIGSTTAGTGTYISQIGHYTRVGNRVDYYIWLAWSAHTGAGDMLINGLPFVSKAACYVPGSIYSSATLGDSVTLTPRILANSTQLELVTSNSITGATANFALASPMASMHIQGTYFI